MDFKEYLNERKPLPAEHAKLKKAVKAALYKLDSWYSDNSDLFKMGTSGNQEYLIEQFISELNDMDQGAK